MNLFFNIFIFIFLEKNLSHCQISTGRGQGLSLQYCVAELYVEPVFNQLSVGVCEWMCEETAPGGSETFVLLRLAVYMRCTGGEVGATSALAPKIGPLGLVSIKID